MSRRARMWGRLERGVLGAVMAVVTRLVERKVTRALERKPASIA